MAPQATLHANLSEPIILPDRKPFGIGGRRLCFTHPDDKTKCVKVLRTDQQRTVRLKKKHFIPSHWRRKYDNNAHEMKILEDLFRRLGPEMKQHFPVSYGMQSTDLGPGLVLDLIRDQDGGISRSIREMVTNGYPLEELKSAFDEFSIFLFENVVLTRNLHDHNLVVQHREDGTWRLYLIDGFGDSAWLPLARWFRPIGRSKVRSRIAVAWPKMENLQPLVVSHQT